MESWWNNAANTKMDKMLPRLEIISILDKVYGKVRKNPQLKYGQDKLAQIPCIQEY